MIPYPASFWRHTVKVYPRTYGRDASLAPTAADGAPFVALANVQENPRHGGRGRFREEVFGGTQSSKPVRIYLKPDPALPAIEAETRIEWGDKAYTAMADPDDRGGHGVALLVDCTEIR